MKLDEYLKQLESLGISVQEFAYRSRIARQSLSKYRKKDFDPNPSNRTLGLARKIVKATKGQVTLKDLGIS